MGLLKAEAKSRANLTGNVLIDARKALQKNRGRPSPFVIAFIVDRLVEEGKIELARAIQSQTAGVRLLKARELAHLLFVFCGNDPTALLQASKLSHHFAQQAYDNWLSPFIPTSTRR